MDTENTRYEPRAMGGSVKQSLAMAIPKAFGFEAATQQSTGDPRFRGDRLTPAQAGGWATPAPSGVEGNGGFTRHMFGGFTRHRFGGFTLAEALMATVVLGIAAAGVLLPFASGAKVRAEGLRSTLAAKLAADLMENIVHTSFNDIVDTYDGYTESQGQLKDANGTEFTDQAYAKFSRDVSCAWDDTQDFFILVTVWVKYNGREIAVINRLISK